MTTRLCCCVPDADAECCTCAASAYSVGLSQMQTIDSSAANGATGNSCGDANQTTFSFVSNQSSVVVPSTGVCVGEAFPNPPSQPTHRLKRLIYAISDISQPVDLSVTSPGCTAPNGQPQCGTHSANSEPGTLSMELACCNETLVQSGTSYWFWGLTWQWNSTASIGSFSRPVWTVQGRAFSTPQTACHDATNAAWDLAASSEPANTFFLNLRYGTSTQGARRFSIRHSLAYGSRGFYNECFFGTGIPAQGTTPAIWGGSVVVS